MKKKKKKTCKYPLCFYHVPGAENYCCLACSCDHYDHIRLKKEAEKAKVTK